MIADFTKTLPKIRKFERSDLRKRFSNVKWNQSGRVCNVVGTIVEAHLPDSQLGMGVDITQPGSNESVLAEVVGFKDEKALLLPFSDLSGISPGCTVTTRKMLDHVKVGDHLLGKIVDPLMQPMDSQKIDAPENAKTVPIEREAPNPLERARIENKLDLGIRAIDGLLTFGEGQRLGIMAGSGVGKSVLMGMIARGSSADVNVIGLIGERGREVREFIERDLGPEGLAKSVVVCVTSDRSPLMRIRGAKTATAIAEHFAAEGKQVLLMMDSLTRVASAQREIGLAIGEPPTTKGYPPSVFALLPRLLERCGTCSHGKGSISGLYTVLVDGDDFNDPLPDATRAILDGHIVLSRSLATRGHFPAIDVTQSTSRVMHDIADKKQWEEANRFKALLGVYEENFDYVQIGSYQHGSNPMMDDALALRPAIETYLKQDITELSSREEALFGLEKIAEARPYAQPQVEMQAAG